jgi:hypothetical protein
MRTFLTEIQHRPDGISNTSINSYSSAAVGLASWYQRAAVAVTTKNYTSVVLTLTSEDGNIMMHESLQTQYEAE